MMKGGRGNGVRSVMPEVIGGIMLYLFRPC